MRHFKTAAHIVSALRYSPDGRSLYLLSDEVHVTSDSMGTLPHHAYCLDLDTGEIAGKWKFPESEIAVFAPDCRGLYFWPAPIPYSWNSEHRYLHYLDLDLEESCVVYGFDDVDAPAPDRCAISEDGNFLALRESRWDDVDVVHQLDLRTMTELAPLRLNLGNVASSFDGQFLATCERAFGLRVWENTTCVAQWNEPAFVATWSPDGRLAWGMDKCIFVARPGTQEPLRSFGSLEALLSGLTFSPDCRLVLSGTRAGVCAFHDPTVGQQLNAFDWKIGCVHSVAFSPDGLTCAAGGEKGQVVVWDVDV